MTITKEKTSSPDPVILVNKLISFQTYFVKQASQSLCFSNKQQIITRVKDRDCDQLYIMKIYRVDYQKKNA